MKKSKLHNHKVEFICSIQNKPVKTKMLNNPTEAAENKIYEMWSAYIGKRYDTKNGWTTIKESSNGNTDYIVVFNEKMFESVCLSMKRTEYVLDLVDANNNPMVINGIYKDKDGQEYQFNACSILNSSLEVYLRYYSAGPGWQHTHDIYEPDQFKCGKLTFVRMWW